MKKILLLLFLLIGGGKSLAQNEDLMKMFMNDYLQIRQYPHTEALLREYISSARSSNDTLYVMMYLPTYCMRCETLINPFYRMLKKEDAKAEFALVSVYKDPKAAEFYVNKNRYMADHYLYDTESLYKKIFSFSKNDMYGMYLLKVCKSTGELLAGGQCGLMTSAFVKQLVAYTGKMEQKDFSGGHGVSDTFEAREPDCPAMKDAYAEYRLEEDGNHPVSDLDGSPEFVGRDFFFNDELENGIMLFGVENDSVMRFSGLLEPDSLEKKAFIKVPDSVYQSYESLARYIPLGPDKVGESIAMSYSLPQFFFVDDPKESDTLNVGYANEAVVLYRNVHSLRADRPMTVFDMDQFDPEQKYFYGHYTIHAYDDVVVMACQKHTWPMQYTAEEYKDIPDMNPFCEAYYEDAPFMAAFDRTTGKLIQRFGKLDSCYRKSRVGHFYSSMVASSSRADLLYGNGYSGKLYVAPKSDLSEVKEEYTVFRVETELFPPCDSTRFYTYEYVNAYNRFFDRNVTSAYLTEDAVYCLVRYGWYDEPASESNRYTFVRINRHTGEKTELSLPYLGEDNVLGYGLKREENGCRPFVFLKENGTCRVRVYEGRI